MSCLMKQFDYYLQFVHLNSHLTINLIYQYIQIFKQFTNKTSHNIFKQLKHLKQQIHIKKNPNLLNYPAEKCFSNPLDNPADWIFLKFDYFLY